MQICRNQIVLYLFVAQLNWNKAQHIKITFYQTLCIKITSKTKTFDENYGTLQLEVIEVQGFAIDLMWYELKHLFQVRRRLNRIDEIDFFRVFVFI